MVVIIEEVKWNQRLYPTLKKQIQRLNQRLKTASKVSECPRRSPWQLIVLSALYHIRAIWHCMIGQELDLPWPMFEIQSFPHILNRWNSRANVGESIYLGRAGALMWCDQFRLFSYVLGHPDAKSIILFQKNGVKNENHLDEANSYE